MGHVRGGGGTGRAGVSGADPGVTLNSSMNKSCATPDTIAAAPDPTRSTATLAGSNEGEGVPVLVYEGEGVDVSVIGGVVDGAGVVVKAAV